jgi:hypothetical protein
MEMIFLHYILPENAMLLPVQVIANNLNSIPVGEEDWIFIAFNILFSNMLI